MDRQLVQETDLKAIHGTVVVDTALIQASRFTDLKLKGKMGKE